MVSIEIKDFKNVSSKKDYSFNVGELCHLVGSSGAGKSTILTAFEWCLYGKLSGIKCKSLKNPIPTVTITLPDGSSITRESNDFKVITSKGVDLDLEEAQGFIYSRFGSKDLWKSMSYLEQGTRNILLTGSAEDKITLLRELVYGYGLSEDSDPDYYLAKTASYLKKVTKEKDRLLIEFNSYSDEYNLYREKYNKSESRWLESGLNRDLLEKKIENIRTEINQLTIDIENHNSTQREITDLEERLSRITFFEDISDKCIESLSKELRELEDKRSLNERNKKIEQFLPFEYNTSKYQDLITDKKKYDFWIREIDRESFPKSKKELESLLSNAEKYLEYSQYEKLLKESSKRKGWEEDVEDIRTEIEDFRKKIDSEYQDIDNCIYDRKNLPIQIEKARKKKTYKCPSCKCNLYITSGGDLTLGQVEVIEELEDKLKKVEKNFKVHQKIKVLEKEIESIKEDIKDSLVEYPEPKEKLEKKENPFRNKDFDKSLNILKKLYDDFVECPNVEELKLYSNGESLAKLLGSDFDIYIEDSRKFTYEDNLNSYKEKSAQIKEEIRALKAKHESNLKSKREMEIIEDHLSELRSRLDIIDLHPKASKNLAKMQDRLKDLHELRIDYVHFDEIESRKESIKNYEEKIKVYEKDLEKIHEIYEKLKAIATEPLEELIDSLNYKINKFLEYLFDDDLPIQVILSLYKPSNVPKKDAKEKIVVNLKISHGDRQYNNINLLSGGESDRVSLALTLALASMGNSPFLFLDECMASLNCELREKCLSLIKEISIDDKIVIDVCHESVEGYHDYVMKV